LNKKETNVGCDFLNKDVLKPFNGTSRNEKHFNNFVPLMEKGPTSTNQKNLNKKNDNKNIIKY
jgi:hypothetical protein